MANKIITVNYTSSGVPQLGLSPIIDIYQLDILSNTQIVSGGSLTEVGGGWYRYNFATYDPLKSYVFTVDGGNSLGDCERYRFGGNESYEEDISVGVWEEPGIAHTSPGTTGLMLNQIKADTATILVSEAAITTLVSTLLKFERNRTKIDVPNAQLIIYDDNCTDVLWTFNLLDASGMPSVDTVCQRVPITC